MVSKSIIRGYQIKNNCCVKANFDGLESIIIKLKCCLSCSSSPKKAIIFIFIVFVDALVECTNKSRPIKLFYRPTLWVIML